MTRYHPDDQPIQDLDDVREYVEHDPSDSYRDSHPADPDKWEAIKRAWLAGDMEAIRKMYADAGMPVMNLRVRQAS